MTDDTIVLGSNSPRRRELLKKMGYRFYIHPTNTAERAPQNTPIDVIPYEIAKLKCQSTLASTKYPNSPIICADTIVVANGHEILGKPNSEQEAIDTLKTLSNREHTVMTGVFIHTPNNEIGFVEKTEVKFAEITPLMIDFYLKSHSAMDKAGSYGIQDWIGIVGIKQIKGCYYNVVGLPTSRVFEAFNDLGIYPHGYK